MDNYQRMLENAAVRFLTYDPDVFRGKTGVSFTENFIIADFLGEKAEISLKTGEITVSGHRADFHRCMCLYDWLCDGKGDACAAGEFAPVSSLSGVLVRGNGLSMETGRLAAAIDARADIFCRACRGLGGRSVPLGDIGFEIPLFADLTVIVKFYHGDAEFSPGCILLWDRNILQFIRYETVYYLAGCLLRRLEEKMAEAAAPADVNAYIQPKGLI